MVCISNVLYAAAKVCYSLASLCEVLAVGLEHQLGNPTVPDQLFILIVLAVFGFRRIAAVWAFGVAIIATFTLKPEESDNFQLLGHAGDFFSLLSR